MKVIRAVLSVVLSLALIIALNTSFGVVPPIGKFLSPFVGFWQNAETRDNLKAVELPLAGLQAEVQIFYDENRVPHIFAHNNYDVYYAQGYVTAKDRLWQMEFQTYAAAGRVSEVVGSKAIEFDRYQRRMGMVYGAQQSLKAMLADARSREMLEAFTAGINAYIGQLKPSDYPLEYKLLNYAPEPWTPLKCALLLKLMAFDLAGRSDDLRMTNILRKYGPAITKDLFPDYPFREDPIVPSGTPLDFKPLPIPPVPASFSAQLAEIKRPQEPDPELGSNNWAVSAAKSATGYPILANDPHLELRLPSIWYQVQLVTPDMNVCGVSLPGAPNVIIGFNQHISWGVTNVDADVMDWYQLKFKDKTQQQYWHAHQWKPIRKVIEEIKIKGAATVFDTVSYTHHGPIVYDQSDKVFNKQAPVKHAMRWIAHDASNEMLAFYLLNRAKNYNDYRQALTFYTAPAQNFIYADDAKNIAIWPNGKFPLKWPDQGKFILDGTNPAYDWQGWIPQAHNPHVENPARGFVSSANQFSADPKQYPYYLNWQFAPAQRGIRINQRLSQMQQVTVDSMRQLQNDNLNLHAQTILPALLAAIQKEKLTKAQQQAFSVLTTWNYFNDAAQIAPSIFQEWGPALDKAIWEDEFGSTQGMELRYPSRDRTMQLILTEPQAHWFNNQNTSAKETLEQLATTTFQVAIDSLQQRYGPLGPKWQWAQVKSTDIMHLAKLPGFGKNDVLTGGGPGIVNATGPRHGPSWRMVVALGPEVQGYGVYPGGQSGNPGSFYYDNLIETWRQGKLNKLLYLKSSSEPAARQMVHLRLVKK
ncbi:penicillin acylase family protein [Adhaeribacter radiodurans]|uniref:Penicillin acylase family protein n=1 Tax=Adhaeribacter radiodurans TaxID=2745197 RepID=A0A7L7L239_9BACT|nr:penicillin acylase family protein [Adhaeribacter radiodurans]QMU26856.1 penicillin acylase family protein [Adhaeribacter radiodurans]